MLPEASRVATLVLMVSSMHACTEVAGAGTASTDAGGLPDESTSAENSAPSAQPNSTTPSGFHTSTIVNSTQAFQADASAGVIDEHGGDAGTTTEPVAQSSNASGADPSSEGSAATSQNPSVVETDADSSSGNGWELVWSDEFTGQNIDDTKWEHEVNCWGGGNNEQQCYVADEKNSFIRDGMLHIVALADEPSGPRQPPDDTSVVSLPYSSARLRTLGKGDWKYGRVEVRAKLPFGQGLWPAIWMLPTDNVYGGWAASGEIDIMEAVNLSPDNNKVYGTLHYGGAWPDNVHTGSETTLPAYGADEFFTYAVEWEEGEIRWFVDDDQYALQNDWNTAEGAPFPAPFDQTFHLLLNVAVGGEWPGPPNEQTTFPQEMIVDYVRVYECSHDPDTGRGC